MQNFSPLFLTLFFLFFCGIIASVVHHLRQRAAKVKHGVRVKGTVVDLNIKGIDLTHRYPVVSFETPEGELLTLESHTKISLLELKKGQTVDIRYLEGNPEKFIIIEGIDTLFE